MLASLVFDGPLCVMFASLVLDLWLLSMQCFFCFHGVFALLIHDLFISIIVLHYVHCYLIKWFSLFYIQTVLYEKDMCSLDKWHLGITTIKTIIIIIFIIIITILVV